MKDRKCKEHKTVERSPPEIVDLERLPSPPNVYIFTNKYTFITQRFGSKPFEEHAATSLSPSSSSNDSYYGTGGLGTATGMRSIIMCIPHQMSHKTTERIIYQIEFVPQ